MFRLHPNPDELEKVKSFGFALLARLGAVRYQPSGVSVYASAKTDWLIPET